MTEVDAQDNTGLTACHALPDGEPPKSVRRWGAS